MEKMKKSEKYYYDIEQWDAEFIPDDGGGATLYFHDLKCCNCEKRMGFFALGIDQRKLSINTLHVTCEKCEIELEEKYNQNIKKNLANVINIDDHRSS